ncbi:Thioredoxin-like superfamily [Sesbania bispinosa]|nr:Thioredoxin-like superfamily [Sesbania bispinosa]
MTHDESVQQQTSSYAVVIFSMNDCWMSVVVKQLIFSLVVGPKVVELDEHVDGPGIRDVLRQFSGTPEPIPDVFIGVKFIGGVDSLITCDLDNKLVPHLKEAGALWLLTKPFIVIWLTARLVMKLTYEYE